MTTGHTEPGSQRNSVRNRVTERYSTQKNTKRKDQGARYVPCAMCHVPCVVCRCRAPCPARREAHSCQILGPGGQRAHQFPYRLGGRRQ
jgi:hypothetical protein